MRILAISTMRNEGMHLLEWLAHHRAIGVTDFLIATNDCADGTDTMLERLAAAGLVTHLHNEVPPGRSPQWAMLKAAWDHPLVDACDWALAIDADEFVNPRIARDLPGLIAAAAGADAIALPWRIFGSSGHVHLSREATLSRFLHAAPLPIGYPLSAASFKTLFRLDAPFASLGVHRPRRAAGGLPRWVDGDLRPLPESFARTDGRILLPGHGASAVALNHYCLRSVAEFMIKRDRGLPNRQGKAVDLAYWVERNFNAVEEVSILEHLPEMRAELARLRALPGLAELEEKAHLWARRRLEELLRDPDEVRLYGRLLLSGDSRVLSFEEGQRLARLYLAAVEAGGREDA